MALRLAHSLALSAALCAGSCGGGGSPKTPVTVTLVATPQLTGPVDSSGVVQNAVGSSDLRVGDSDGASGEPKVRGFVSFDLSGIPLGARILDATLTLTQESTFSMPYPNLGSVVVDQVVYGGTLDAGAYSRSFPVNQAFATLSTSAALGPRTVSATIPVQGDIDSLRTRAQFRVRFTIETDGGLTTDEAVFTGPHVPPGANDPSLVVTYQP